MNRRLSVSEILEAVNGEMVHAGARDSVRAVVASSLMSDVLTVDEKDVLLVSNLTTAQVIRTADVIDAGAVLLATGKSVIPATVQLAKELNITLLRTPLSLFEACYRLGKLVYGGD